MHRRGRSVLEGRRLATALVLIVALVAAAGLCITDAHAGSHHGGSPAHDHDLCVGAPDAPRAMSPGTSLVVAGRAPIAAAPDVTVSALDVLELPPKR